MKKSDDFHCFRTDPQARWTAIAGVLEFDPAASDWALANIARWLAQGRLHPAPLLEWRRILLAARKDETMRLSLSQTLRNPPLDAHQEQLRACSPFVGGPFLATSAAAQAL